ncbi:hypothetical protein Moror_17441 [Moniliophthora roreri MCA 2997]|uniref:LYC1 C-terminal domain-containing protein n=2 Tax=Moniliophthora roreri TaxID=221103 RepID=V2Z1A6_MONRO|nr:hypothetical protein Moror_17441 [Moniliophthora roreri MCA 2997]
MSKSDIASFSLFLATQAQIIESYRRTQLSWSRGMGEDEYIQHNQHISNTFECARDGKLVVWVLAPRDDPETLDFKCSCETFRRSGLVAGKGSDIVEEVTCYGIASVFTPPQHRGRGYARHMMSLLHWVIASDEYLQSLRFPEHWGEPPIRVPSFNNARFSALYSDVGSFYEKCSPAENESGWIIRDPKKTIWNVQILLDRLGHTTEDIPSEWLNLDNVNTVWEGDIARIREEFASSPQKPVFSFLPTGGVENFQRMRLESIWRKESVREWGFVLAGSELDFTTWAVELRESKPRILILTRLRAGESSLPTLLYKSAVTAGKHDISQIEVWNLNENLESQAESLGGVTSVRGNHLPAFKWYGKEKAESVTWAHNEK